ncbi:hypothetical protein ACIBAH_06100 [Streptomyces sp. NPDC051445]|uniref:hypothetical protein n=1 Tax=unclassified Streptomyces TaxID=2593676 RepID=UPI00378E910E
MSERAPRPEPDSAPDHGSGADPDVPRYEPPPGVGKLLAWILLFVVAAVVVVLGGVYFA